MIITLTNLVSCSSTRVDLPSYDELLRAQTKQDGRACVRQHNISGYGLLGDDVVSISAPSNKRYYLATTLFQCQSLQTSFRAGFKGDFSELCGGGRDKIVTTEEYCPIKSIFEFGSRKEAFDTFDIIEKIRKDLTKEAQAKVELDKGQTDETE